MAEVLLFHHALGLTPGIEMFADDIRRAGHTVHTPDLFEGRTFKTIDEGVGYAAKQVGFGEIIQRGTLGFIRLNRLLDFIDRKTCDVAAVVTAQLRQLVGHRAR